MTCCSETKMSCRPWQPTISLILRRRAHAGECQQYPEKKRSGTYCGSMAQCTTGIYTIDYGTYCPGRHEIMSRHETYQNNCVHRAIASRLISASIDLLVAIDKSLGGIDDEPSSPSLFTRNSNGFLCHIVYGATPVKSRLLGPALSFVRWTSRCTHSWLHLYTALM